MMGKPTSYSLAFSAALFLSAAASATAQSAREPMPPAIAAEPVSPSAQLSRPAVFPMTLGITTRHDSVNVSQKPRQSTFPRRTLIGAAIGAVLGFGVLIVLQDGTSLIPGPNEAAFPLILTGVGAAVGYSFEK